MCADTLVCMEWSIFGLPVHPLVVHAAVVLVPLAALGVILCACVPPWRKRFGGLVAIIGVLGAVSSWMALQSGRALASNFGGSDAIAAHGSLGSTVLWYVVPLAAASVAVWLLGRRKLARWLTTVVVVLAVLVGAANVVQIIRIGHSGAEAVWGGFSASAE